VPVDPRERFVMGKPPLSPKDATYIGCPYCTIQIPADTVECPHCRKVLPGRDKPAEPAPVRTKDDFRRMLKESSGMKSLPRLWERHGKWIKVGGLVLAAFLLLCLVYGMWVGHKVTVVPNPELPIKVKKEKKGNNLVLNVMVTNLGQDVPDLSLKSIGVVAEIVYRDGRREKKTYFPKAEYRGEGALLNGETGAFEFETPSKGLKEVILRSEVVDLSMGRKLITPGSVR